MSETLIFHSLRQHINEYGNYRVELTDKIRQYHEPIIYTIVIIMEGYSMLNNFKNIKKPKKILFFACITLILVLLLSGCNLGKTAENTNGNQKTPTEKPQPSSSELEVSKAIGSDNKEIMEGPKSEGFLAIEEFFKDYNFDISFDENLEFYQRTYWIHGVYDMNGDGEDDRINMVLKADYQKGSYIDVNGNILMIDYCNPSGQIKMIDLDSKDSYTEIAVFDDGESADPTLMFFRYDGKEVHFVGSIDQDGLMDGDGKFISSFHLSRYFHPQFYSAWGEFKDSQYVLTNHDVKQYIGKTFEVSGTGFFVPLDNIPKNYFEYITWDGDTVREFHETKVKILDIYISDLDRTLNWFFVELPKGERGLLYFWIGD